MYLIASLFDSHNKSIDEYMELQDWRTGYRHLTRILTLLDNNKNIVLGNLDSEDVSDGILLKKSDETGDEQVKPVVNENVIKIVGSLENFLSRLGEEYTKSIQQINPHTQVSLEALRCRFCLLVCFVVVIHILAINPLSSILLCHNQCYNGIVRSRNRGIS